MFEHRCISGGIKRIEESDCVACLRARNKRLTDGLLMAAEIVRKAPGVEGFIVAEHVAVDIERHAREVIDW
ncbi:MAG: hypothetical protein MI757_14710 [Pirellulales bacterium]|nr:hypothetical protein [Pirellulales bacterium]